MILVIMYWKMINVLINKEINLILGFVRISYLISFLSARMNFRTTFEIASSKTSLISAR